MGFCLCRDLLLEFQQKVFKIIRFCYVDHALQELAVEDIFLQRLVVPKGTPGYFSIQSAQGWVDNLGGTCANHRGSREINHKKTMIANTVSYRHDTRMCYLEVACHPDYINPFTAPKECSAELFAR